MLCLSCFDRHGKQREHEHTHPNLVFKIEKFWRFGRAALFPQTPKRKLAMNTNDTISEILSNKGNNVWSVSPDVTVFDAIHMMAEKNVGALLVVQNEKLVGIISERDYTRKVILQGKSSKQTPVKEILSSHVVEVSPSHTVEECLRLMTDHRVRHLPVMENGRIVGVVSIGDLVNWIISAQSTTIHQLQTYIAGYPG
jgi:CBS domain-containing protein